MEREGKHNDSINKNQGKFDKARLKKGTVYHSKSRVCFQIKLRDELYTIHFRDKLYSPNKVYIMTIK